MLRPDTPIVIGDVKIDPIDYAIRRNGNLGINETGKTYAGGYFAEQLMKRAIPIVSISPSPGRVWRYLKIGREGKQGFPVVVVGDDGDIPLSKDTAADIMRAAMQEGVSVVFDVHSRHISKADFRHVVADVVNVLYYENEQYGLRHCFLEEVGDLAPQRIYDKVTYGAVERFVREGGNSKVGVTILNPRAENVNKEVLELCSSLFLFQQTGRNSVKNLSKFFEQMDTLNREEIIKSFSSLKRGQCWYWEAATRLPVLIQIPEKDTIHPNRRELSTNIDVPQGKSVDVTEFVQRMNDALAKRKAVSVSAPKKKTVDQVIADDIFTTDMVSPEQGKILKLQADNARLEKLLEERSNELLKTHQMAVTLQNKLEAVKGLLLPQYEQMQNIFGEIGNGQSEPSVDFSHYDHWFPQLVGYQKDMFRLFIEHHRLTDKKLALLLGTTPNNGTFTEYRNGLKRKGLIYKDGTEWVIVEL